jgi:colicin import membrane protein
MNLKAVKASYGDFGRVQRGTILKDIPRDLAEKLLKSGAYVEATAVDIQQADKQRELPKTDAELDAQKAKAEADARAAAEAKAREEAAQKARAEADAKAAAEARAKEEAARKAKAAADAKAAAEAKTSGQK